MSSSVASSGNRARSALCLVLQVLRQLPRQTLALSADSRAGSIGSLPMSSSRVWKNVNLPDLRVNVLMARLPGRGQLPLTPHDDSQVQCCPHIEGTGMCRATIHGQLNKLTSNGCFSCTARVWLMRLCCPSVSSRAMLASRNVQVVGGSLQY